MSSSNGEGLRPTTVSKGADAPAKLELGGLVAHRTRSPPPSTQRGRHRLTATAQAVASALLQDSFTLLGARSWTRDTRPGRGCRYLPDHIMSNELLSRVIAMVAESSVVGPLLDTIC